MDTVTEPDHLVTHDLTSDCGRRGRRKLSRRQHRSDPRQNKTKKPTWSNTRRCSTTSAYSSTSPPAQPGCSLSSHPTNFVRESLSSTPRLFHCRYCTRVRSKGNSKGFGDMLRRYLPPSKPRIASRCSFRMTYSRHRCKTRLTRTQAGINAIARFRTTISSWRRGELATRQGQREQPPRRFWC